MTAGANTEGRGTSTSATRLADLTTLRLGGPARRLLQCGSENEIVSTVRTLDAAGENVLILGGGSNLVVADEGFPGTVVRILTSGSSRLDAGDHTLLEVQAGETWDGLVARCVEDGLAGLECLSGIPGLVGATPIQNVGAYGSDVRETIVRVRVYDREAGQVHEMRAEECEFSYRSSVFKRTPGRWVVLAVTFRLRLQDVSVPIRYDQLTKYLGVAGGETVPLRTARQAVLDLRRAKGMVLVPDDPDTRSAGSFFLNPILSPSQFDSLQRRVAEHFGPDARPPAFAEHDGRIKTSAAWLIERAGFGRGYGNPLGIAISSKHSLALTNRGSGTARELAALGSRIIEGVENVFGVTLAPEPVLVGVTLRS